MDLEKKRRIYRVSQLVCRLNLHVGGEHEEDEEEEEEGGELQSALSHRGSRRPPRRRRQPTRDLDPKKCHTFGASFAFTASTCSRARATQLRRIIYIRRPSSSFQTPTEPTCAKVTGAIAHECLMTSVIGNGAFLHEDAEVKK